MYVGLPGLKHADSKVMPVLDRDNLSAKADEA